MKKIRVAALVLAIAMFALCAVSCGNKAEKVKVNCTFSVIINDEVMLDQFPYTVQGTVDNPPTILQAAQEAFQMAEVPCEVDSEGLSLQALTFDGTKYANGMDDENVYMWYYTINGVEPDKNGGRAGKRPIEEGQNICYINSANHINPQEYSDE